MGGTKMITVAVPEGFPPMSIPCDPSTRMDAADITLRRVEMGDLDEIAHGVHTAFPELWWGKHEPASIRAPPEVRRQRLAKRMGPYAKHPDVHGIVAVDRSTGALMGFAGWHFIKAGGRKAGIFGYKAFRGKSEEEWGFPELMGWSDEDVDEMWRDINMESFNKEFVTYDRVRYEELGDEPHWYLAPFFVDEKFRGRGVGRALLEYGMQLADKHEPPLSLYLEALPNARPVYLHVGFEPREGVDRETVLVRPPKKE